MKRLLIAAICVLAFTSGPAFADEASKRKAVLDLLEVTNVRGLLDQTTKNIETRMRQQFEAASAGFPPEGREEMKAVQKDFMRWVSEVMSWEQMRDMYVDIYAQVFTEDEINEILQFYRTPLGQKMISKMPEVVQKSMQKSQSYVQKIMPELVEKLKKALEDLKAKYKT